MEQKMMVESICNSILENKQKHSKPKCILIGGLPGAGKSNLVEKIVKQYSDRDFVVIDADNYRKLHPDYKEITKEPETAIFKTIDFANAIESELIKKSFISGLDIISVSTLRATEAINKILYEPAIENGYEIELHIISTPIAECALSAQQRYEEQIKSKEFPRLVGVGFIKDSLKGIRETIQLMQSKPNVPLINIYNRGIDKQSEPEVVYSNYYPNNRYNGLVDALLNPRKFVTSSDAAVIIKKLYEIKENRGASETEFDALEGLQSLYDLNIENERV